MSFNSLESAQQPLSYHIATQMWSKTGRLGAGRQLQAEHVGPIPYQIPKTI